MRLIDADRLLDLLNDNQAQQNEALKGSYYDGVGNGLEVAIVCVEYAPTVEERKRGHWIFTQDMMRYDVCSVCGSRALFEEFSFDTVTSNYCPHCGAVMDEEADNGR